MIYTLSILTYSKSIGRLSALIDKKLFSNVDLNIFAMEDFNYVNRYQFSESTRTTWHSNLNLIHDGLLRNLSLANSGVPLNHNQLKIIPPWMQPRELKYGDLSIMSKHLRALQLFLEGSKRYTVIFEDDIILDDQYLNVLEALISNLTFDYLDLAGGDNIEITSPTHEIMNNLLYKDPLKSTRTACAYAISRRAAEFAVSQLINPVFPIDWALSSALQLSSDLDVYWLCQNSSFKHGSSIGHFKSWREQ